MSEFDIVCGKCGIVPDFIDRRCLCDKPETLIEKTIKARIKRYPPMTSTKEPEKPMRDITPSRLIED